MKNKTTALYASVLTAMLLVAAGEQTHATPYASGVTNQGGNVSFVLNDAADNVKVVFSGPSSTLDLGAMARGSYSFPHNGATSFQIQVTKSAPPVWTRISDDDTNALLQFFAPISLSVNRNPASPHFGRIYVLEDGGQVSGGRLTTEGIFVLNADITDAFGQGDSGLQAGLSALSIWAGTGTSDRYDPFQIEVGDDDYVYLTDANDPRGGLLRADATVATGEPVLEGIGNAAAPSVHTVLYGIHTKGSLTSSNLVIWATDGQWVNGGSDANNSVLRWDINEGPLPHNVAPTLVAQPGPAASEKDSDLDIAPDGNVFVAIAPDPAPATSTGVPAVQVFNSTGTLLWSSMISGTDVFTNAYSLEVSPDNTKLAIVRRDRQTWIVGLTNGPAGRIPDLSTTNLLASFTGSAGNGRSIAWDRAGNLYVGNRSNERVRIFSPGGTTTATTRSDGTFAITVPANTVAISNSVATISESDGTPIVLTITRTGNTAEPLTASFLFTGTASNGVDHTTFPTSIVFPAGVSTTNINITISNDSTAEFTETLIAAVNSGTNYSVGTPASATVTILDDETPEVSVALAQAESRLLEGFDGSRVGFQLTRKGLLTSGLTVNVSYSGAASPGADFTGPSTVPLAAGVVNATFNIAPVNDGGYEGSEAAIVLPGAGTGYTVEANNSATATIIDDEHPPGAVLFADDFETNSAPRWTVNSADGGFDSAAEFAYDYSQVFVPPAPGGSSTLGLRFRINEQTGAPRNAIAASPLALNLAGDYRLKFNMWINYNGPMFDGGSGSTLHLTTGAGTTADHANLATSALSDGIWFGMSGDGGSTLAVGDCNAYAAIDLLNDDSGVYAAGTGAVNSGIRKTTHPFYALWGNIPAPAAQLANFPGQTGVSGPGNLGVSWHTVVVTKATNTITLVIDGITVATVPERVALSTNVFVGFQDLFAGAAGVPAMGFALVDNLRVETFSTAAPPTPIFITSIKIVGANVEITFTGPAAAAASAFKLTSAGIVNGTYNDDNSTTLESLGAGSFKATTALNGAARFYRIKY